MIYAKGDFPNHVAVIGGGRWARVIVSVLSDLLPIDSRITLCSPGNACSWNKWLSNQSASTVRNYRIETDIEQLISDNSLTDVIIARAARDNASTAIASLRAGKKVFIEKPFALDAQVARDVIAESKQQFCVTGLVFLFATNLHRFAKALSTLGQWRKIHITWHDKGNEIRHLETKGYDQSLNCVLDVFPHIWSILRLLHSSDPLTSVNSCAIDGGRQVLLELLLGDIPVHVDIARDTSSRQRTLRVEGHEHHGQIDFSQEPGRAFVKGQSIDVSEDFSSPLARELNAFLRGLAAPFGFPFYQIEHAIESIFLAQDMLPAIRFDQYSQIKRELKEASSPEAPNGCAICLAGTGPGSSEESTTRTVDGHINITHRY